MNQLGSLCFWSRRRFSVRCEPNRIIGTFVLGPLCQWELFTKLFDEDTTWLWSTVDISLKMVHREAMNGSQAFSLDHEPRRLSLIDGRAQQGPNDEYRVRERETEYGVDVWVMTALICLAVLRREIGFDRRNESRRISVEIVFP